MSRRVSADAAEQLPAAPCRICGVTVKASTGHVVPEVFSGFGDSSGVVLVHGQIRSKEDRWDRQHDDCRPSWGWIISQLLGLELSESEAEAVIQRAPIVSPLAWYRGTPAKRKPFDFVGDNDRKTLQFAWERVRRQTRPSRSTEGACGMCGIATAKGWTTSPLKWSDGTGAPFCSACRKSWEKAMRPSDPEELRYVAESEFTTVPRIMGGAHSGMRVFTDVAGNDHAGHETRWRYAPAALREIRRRAIRANPRYAATEQEREMVERLNRIKEMRGQRAEQEAEANSRPGADLPW